MANLNTYTFPGPKVARSYPDGSARVHSVSLSSAESISSFASDTPITPPAAYYSTQQVQEDQLADFFGASRKSRTRAAVPPPYPSDGDARLPSYDAPTEPVTLARFMFIYGFSACFFFYTFRR